MGSGLLFFFFLRKKVRRFDVCCVLFYLTAGLSDAYPRCAYPQSNIPQNLKSIGPIVWSQSPKMHFGLAIRQTQCWCQFLIRVPLDRFKSQWLSVQSRSCANIEFSKVSLHERFDLSVCLLLSKTIVFESMLVSLFVCPFVCLFVCLFVC